MGQLEVPDFIEMLMPVLEETEARTKTKIWESLSGDRMKSQRLKGINETWAGIIGTVQLTLEREEGGESAGYRLIFDTKGAGCDEITFRGPDYAMAVTEESVKNEILPALEVWFQDRIDTEEYGGFYDMYLEVDVQLGGFGADGKTGFWYNTLKLRPDEGRRGQWRQILVKAILDKTYTAWPVRSGPAYLEALYLQPQVGSEPLHEYLAHWDRPPCYLNESFYYWEEHTQEYFAGMNQKPALSKEEMQSFYEMLKLMNEFNKKEMDFYTEGVQILLDNGFEPLVPRAQNAGQILDALVCCYEVWEAAALQKVKAPGVAAPGEYSELTIMWNATALEPGVVKIGRRTEKKLEQRIDLDISMLLTPKLYKDEVAPALQQWLADRMKATPAALYYPSVNVRVNISCSSFRALDDSAGSDSIDDDFFLKQAERYEDWTESILHFIQAKEYIKGDLAYQNTLTATAFLDILENQPPKVYEAFFTTLLKRVKADGKKFSWTQYDPVIRNRLKTILEEGAVPQGEMVQDFWVYLAKLYHAQSDKYNRNIGRQALLLFYRTGNAKARELMKDFVPWQDPSYWDGEFVSDELWEAVSRKKLDKGALYKAKRDGRAIVLELLEESENAYGQALDYLTKEVPKAAEAARENDWHYVLSIKFKEKPVFPPVPLRFSNSAAYIYEEQNEKWPGISFLELGGFYKTPELAFFARAVQWPSLHEKVKAYAGKLLKGGWHINDDEYVTSAASNAIISLVLADEEYLNLAEKYAAEADDEHEGIQLYLIPAIIKKYGINRKTADTIIQLGFSFQNGEEYLESIPRLEPYMNEEE